MAFINKANNILKRFRRDESGVAALSWALSLTAIIGAMGAALDFAMLTSADARSQTIADTTALAAAIYVKNFEELPKSREDGLIGEYTADELGYDYRNWVIDGAEGVSVNIVYDNVKREAKAVVEGYTNPTLMQILGFNELKFRAESVVKYFEKDIQDPASVVLVLDNSGSMAFDDLPIDSDGNAPPEAERRMDGLKRGAKNFMALLDESVGPQTVENGPRVLRTGMMAFDGEIISSRTKQMDWGVISDSQLDAMTPVGSTNSTPPLIVANTWLNVNEPAVHALENPGKTPLKFVILMTDGKNAGNLEWVDRENTETWRRYVTGRETTEGLSDYTTNQVETVPEQCEYENRYQRMYDYDWYGVYWFGEWDDEQITPYNRRHRRYGPYRVYSNPTPSQREVCTPAEYETRYSGYEYSYGEESPGSEWTEGEFDVPANIASRAQCDTLHAAGVEVFTIGFALVPGQFETNEWANRPGAYSPYPSNGQYNYSDSVESTNLAKSMLQYCASSDRNFITADNTTALDEAFDRIGNTIIKEIIRISS
ncbi:TadE/TadG family type IV pilus assembly protein [Hellea balneolensis]|uniref:TadE/TadG family type IV pilus assembly protein n=1 Tax=Hellea balneolensis TaxID=287478 RepID=UPI00042A38EF|nr:Tad domain-containing protein [Hellea balneolensis]